MSRTTPCAVGLAVALVGLPRVTQGQECKAPSPTQHPERQFGPPNFVRTLVGFGGVPLLPDDDRTGNVVLTGEVGEHLLNGALATGVSVSSTTDVYQHWNVLTPGIFASLDLTYAFMTGLWAYPPPKEEDAPLHIDAGSRLGLALSESLQPQQGPPPGQNPAKNYQISLEYKLWRPELGSFLDVVVPFWLKTNDSASAKARYALVFRGEVDTALNLSDVFRYSFSAGLSYRWGGT